MAGGGEFSGVALRAARVRAGLTQHELAVRVGIAGGERVSLWELGVASPQAAMLARLAKALDLEPEYLLEPVTGARDLRRLRLAAGMSSREAARRALLAPATYIKWEAGAYRRFPADSSLVHLAAAFHVTLDEVRAALVESRRRAELQE